MRRLPALAVRVEDRAELEGRAASAGDSRSARRARVVLLAARGLSNRQIASVLGVHYNRVAFWRRRYQELGLAGLDDEERPGRPVTYGPREILELVRLLGEGGEEGLSRWTLAGLAAGLADRGVPISRSQVRRLCVAIEVDSSFAGRPPAARPLPLDCRVAIVGLFLREEVRAVFSALTDPAGVVSPAGGKGDPAARPLGSVLAAAETPETAGAKLLDILSNGLARPEPAGSGEGDDVLVLAERLLRALPAGSTLSCTVMGLPAYVATALAAIAPDRLVVHATTREETWTNRLNLLLALADEQVCSDRLVAAAQLQALVRALRRNEGSCVWAAAPPALAAAS